MGNAKSNNEHVPVKTNILNQIQVDDENVNSDFELLTSQMEHAKSNNEHVPVVPVKMNIINQIQSWTLPQSTEPEVQVVDENVNSDVELLTPQMELIDSDFSPRPEDETDIVADTETIPQVSDVFSSSAQAELLTILKTSSDFENSATNKVAESSPDMTHNLVLRLVIGMIPLFVSVLGLVKFSLRVSKAKDDVSLEEQIEQIRTQDSELSDDESFHLDGDKEAGTIMDTKAGSSSGLYNCVEIAPVLGTPTVKVRSVRRSRRLSRKPPTRVSIPLDMVIDSESIIRN